MSKIFLSITVAPAIVVTAFAFLVSACPAADNNKTLVTRVFPLLARIKTDNRVAHLICTDQVLLNSNNNIYENII